mgnify:CR=1 FL=1
MIDIEDLIDENFTELCDCTDDEQMGWSFWFKLIFFLWVFG